MSDDRRVYFRQMARMRAFDEACLEGVPTFEIHGELHTGIGQEAIEAGIASTLRPGDALVSTHRNHYHAHAVAVLMAVDERVVHADVGQLACQDQRLGLQALQEDLQIGAEEAGLAPVDDQVLPLAFGSQRLDELGIGRAFHAMHTLVAIELPAEVGMAHAVSRGEEDDRHSRLARHPDHPPDALHPTLEARHGRDARLLERQAPAPLHVEHDQHGIADNLGGHGVGPPLMAASRNREAGPSCCRSQTGRRCVRNMCS